MKTCWRSCGCDKSPDRHEPIFQPPKKRFQLQPNFLWTSTAYQSQLCRQPFGSDSTSSMSLFQPPTHSGLLDDMLKHPLVFGEVVQKGNWATSGGTKEVTMGPRSPPRRSVLPNGSTKPSLTNEHADSPSTSRIVTPPTTPRSPSKSANSSSPALDRKGKSTSSPKHTADIDLSWPSSIVSLRRPAAGLYNPSMACYANATLQILLHTPPVLRIAQEHKASECEAGCPSQILSNRLLMCEKQVYREQGDSACCAF